MTHLVIRLSGPVLISVFYVILGLVVDAMFRVVTKILYIRLGVGFTFVWVSVGVGLTANLVYNHVMACVVIANGPRELRIIEQLRMKTKRRLHRKDVLVDSDRYEGLSAEMKQLLRYRSKTLADLSQSWTRFCKECNEIKPGRTHHCSTCNHCVFMRDHHCPWINNCVGLENYRYFLLFLFYLLVDSVWAALTIVSIWDHHIYVSPL